MCGRVHIVRDIRELFTLSAICQLALEGRRLCHREPLVGLGSPVSRLARGPGICNTILQVTPNSS